MSRDPWVWVAERAPFDYSPARRYGTRVIPLRGERMSPNMSPEWNQQIVDELRLQLRDYKPGVDFVIPTGHPVRMLLVGMLLRERGSAHNILGWDDKAQRYMAYSVELEAPVLCQNHR